MTWAQKYAEFLDQLAVPSGVRAETAVAHDVLRRTDSEGNPVTQICFVGLPTPLAAVKEL